MATSLCEAARQAGGPTVNAVEVEEAVSTLAAEPYDAAELPFAFLSAFGNEETAAKRPRSGAATRSDVGGVLRRCTIHLATCLPGRATDALRASPKTATRRARLVLATDGG